MQNSSKARRVLALMVSLFYFLVSPASLAQVSPTPPVPVNLDLTSTAANVPAAKLVNPVTILVGGQQKTISPGDSITAAERLAVYQVLSTQSQSIQIGALGNAIGGSFMMGPRFAEYVSNLVIPKGVTAVKDFASSAALNLAGNLTNSGTLQAVSSNSQVLSGTIAAQNIFNLPTGVVTSVLPKSLAGISAASLVPNLSLNLNAVQDIVNYGVISSAGSLNLNAGGSIANYSTATQQAVMSAQNITAITGSGNFVNSGLITANAGNLNIMAALDKSLSINNQAGVMRALAGEVNLGTLTHSADAAINLSVKSGTVSGQAINLLAPGGKIDVDAETLNGPVNLSGCDAKVTTQSGGLNIASMDLSGDPVFTSVSGPLVVSLTFSGGNFGTGGEDFIAYSGGNVSISGAPVGGATINAAGGRIRIGAGVSFDANNNLLGSTTGGGDILLSGINLTSAGGNVTLIAYKGSSGSGNINVGDINTRGTQISGQNGGQVVISSGGSITAGNIQASGASGTFSSNGAAGAAGTVGASGGAFTSGSDGGVGGTGSAGGAGGAGGNGGLVSLFAPGDVTTGFIQSFGGLGRDGGTGGAGGAGGNGGNGGDSFVASNAGDGGYGGRGGEGGDGGNGGTGGNGGDIAVTAGGSLSAQGILAFGGLGGNGGAGGTGGAGGQGGTGGTAYGAGASGTGGTGGAGFTGGAGGNAGAGGAGGTVTLSGAVISLGAPAPNTSGGAGGTGGSGGLGGAGGSGTGGTVGIVSGSGGGAGTGGFGGPGGGGGRGGNGAAIEVTSGSTLTAIGLFNASGGKGGVGGGGGSGNNAGASGGGSDTFLYGGAGGAGGRGGSAGAGGEGGMGGSAASITLTSASLFSLSGAIAARGGIGGAGGRSGDGGDGTNGSDGGGGVVGGSGGSGGAGGAVAPGGVGGNGGNGARVTVSSNFSNILVGTNTGAAIDTSGGGGGGGGAGGNGGDGGNGGSSGLGFDGIAGANGTTNTTDGIGISLTLGFSFGSIGEDGGLGGVGGNGGIGGQPGGGGDVSVSAPYGNVSLLGDVLTFGGVGGIPGGPGQNGVDGAAAANKTYFGMSATVGYKLDQRFFGSGGAGYVGGTLTIANVQTGVTVYRALKNNGFVPIDGLDFTVTHLGTGDTASITTNIGLSPTVQFKMNDQLLVDAAFGKAGFKFNTLDHINQGGYYDIPPEVVNRVINRVKEFFSPSPPPNPDTSATTTASDIGGVQSYCCAPSGGDLSIQAGGSININGKINALAAETLLYVTGNDGRLLSAKAVLGTGGSVILNAPSVTVTGGPTGPPANDLTIGCGSLTVMTNVDGVNFLIKPVIFSGLLWNTNLGLNIGDGNGKVLISTPVRLIQNGGSSIDLSNMGPADNRVDFFNATFGSNNKSSDLVILSAGDLLVTNRPSFATIRADAAADHPGQIIIAAGDAAATHTYGTGPNDEVWVVLGANSETGGSLYMPSVTIGSATTGLVYLAARHGLFYGDLTTGNINVSQGSNGSIPGQAFVFASDNITMGTITGASASLNSVNGIIGSFGENLQVNVPNLSVKTSNLAYINDNLANVNLGESFANGLFINATAGNLNVRGPVYGGIVSLEATQKVNLFSSVTSLHSDGGVVFLISGPSITDANGLSNITAPSIHLISKQGNVNVGTLSAGSSITLEGQTSSSSVSGQQLNAPFVVLYSGTGGATVTMTTAEEVVANSSGDVNVTSSSNNVIIGGVGALPTNGRDFNVTSGGSISVTGGIASTRNVTLTAQNDGSISFAKAISAQGTITLNAAGDGSISQTNGFLLAPTVNLNAADGDIGTSDDPILLGSGTINFNSSGNVYLVNASDERALTVGAWTGQNLVIAQTGDLTITGALNASGKITLLSFDGGSITLNDDVTAEGKVYLVATSSEPGMPVNSGFIHQLHGKVITASTVEMEAANGGIGAIRTATQHVKATTQGGVVILNSGTTELSGEVGMLQFENDAGVTVKGMKSYGALSVSALGDILLSGPVEGQSVTITSTATDGSITLGGNVISSSSLALTATGTGSITRTGVTAYLSGTSINLTSGSGGVGTSSKLLFTRTGNLTVNTNAQVFFDNDRELSLNIGHIQSLVVRNAGTLTLPALIDARSASGNGGFVDILVSGGSLNGGNIFTGTTDQTATGGRIKLYVPDGDTQLNIADAGASGNGGAIEITSKGITIAASLASAAGAGSGGLMTITGTSISIKQISTSSLFGSGGGITVSGDSILVNNTVTSNSQTNTGGAISLTANNGMLETGNVSANGVSGGSITLIASGQAIETGSLETKATGTTSGAGGAISATGGSLKLASLDSTASFGPGGAITVTGDSIEVASSIFSRSSNNAGGAVTLTANNGGISISSISAHGFGTGRSGGAITLSAAGAVTTFLLLTNGFSGANAGSISINATGYDVETGNLEAKALTTAGGAGGVISVSGAQLNVPSVNTSSLGSSGGAVTLTASKGSQIGTITTTGSGSGKTGGQVSVTLSGDFESPLSSIFSNGVNGASGGSITVSAAAQAIVLEQLEANGSGSGSGGAVSVTAVAPQVTSVSTRAENGTGGSISLSSTAGSLQVLGDLTSSSSGGTGGAVTVTAPTYVYLHSIDASGSNGNGGAVAVSGLDVQLTSVAGSSFDITTGGNVGSVNSSLPVNNGSSSVFLAFHSAGDVFITNNGGLIIGDSSASNVFITTNASISRHPNAVNPKITAATIQLQSSNGNIGESVRSLRVQTSSLDVQAPHGSIYVSNSGTLQLLSTSLEGNFSLHNDSSVTVNSIFADGGSLSVTTSAGTLTVAPGAYLQSIGGSTTLQNTSAAGNIYVGENSTIMSSKLTGGSVSLFLGNAPSNVTGSAPAGVVSAAVGGASVRYGTNSVRVEPAGAQVFAYGADSKVILDTNGAPAASITLGGNTFIGSGKARPLLSLDLTDPSVTSAIRSNQQSGAMGGSLVVNVSGVATGGTLAITPVDLAPSISQFTLPANVALTLTGFAAVKPVRTPGSIMLGGTVNSSNGSLVLLGHDFELTGAVNAPGGQVTLSPYLDSQSIVVGASPAVAGAFNLSAANLQKITAKTLVLGSSSQTGGIQIAGMLDAAALANITNLNFFSRGEINIGADISAPKTVVLFNGGSISGGGLVNTVTLNYSSTGNIGSSALPVNFIAKTLNVVANGSAFVNSSAAINFAGISRADGAGGFNVTSGGTVTLETGAEVRSAESVNVSVVGKNKHISQTGRTGGFITPQLTLSLSDSAMGLIGNAFTTVRMSSGVSGVPTSLKVSSGRSINIESFDSVADSGSVVLSGNSLLTDQFKLTAAGYITLDGSVSARQAILTTTEANQGITQISRGASLLSASVQLVSRGDIGSSTSPVQLQNPSGATLSVSLNATSTSSVFVATSNSLILTGNSSAAGTFSAVSDRNIDVTGTVTARSSIELSAGVDASIKQASTTATSLFSPSMSLSAGGASVVNLGKIGTVTAPIRTSNINSSSNPVQLSFAAGGEVNLSHKGTLLLLAPNLSFNGRINVTDKFILSVDDPTHGITVGGVAPAGDLSVTASLFTRVIAPVYELGTANLSGDITLAGPFVSTKPLTLRTGGGSIVGSGLLTAPKLTFLSATGDIGGSTALNTKAPIISATTGGAGSVSLSNATAMELLASSSGGSFSILAAGALKVNSISTNAPLTSDDGSISVVNTSGMLTVNGNLSARGGSIFVQNRDVVGGSIVVSPGVSISTLVDKGTALDNGTVTLAIGTSAPQLTSGSAPLGVRLTPATAPGAYYFGSHPAAVTTTATAATAPTLNALGRNVVFESPNNNRKITLGKNVTITADPPGMSVLSGMSRLFAPSQTTDVKTEFGTVTVHPGAIVVIAGTDKAAVVYNLHEAKTGDVVVNAGTRHIPVRMGEHTAVTDSSVRMYTGINPPTGVTHREIERGDLGNGFAVFSSEFSIVSALNNLKAVSALKNSANPSERRLYQRLLKDAAILMQTGGARGAYRQI